METAEHQALVAALAWQVAMGADEAILPVPPDRAAARAPQTAPRCPAPARPAPAALAAATLAPAALAPAALAPAALARPPTGGGAAAAADTLEALREAMTQFEGSPLRDTATQMVFADGVPGAPVMVVGEAPGADEDRIGRPFVGVSGRLMDRMFASIGLGRQAELYVTNILPYRPPGNRTPSDAEIALFLPFLRRHVALASPRVLVLAGGVAAKALLGTREGITRLRGKWHQYSPGEGPVIPALPTLHPAYLLRNPIAKREAWRDLLLLRRHLDDGEKKAD